MRTRLAALLTLAAAIAKAAHASAAAPGTIDTPFGFCGQGTAFVSPEAAGRQYPWVGGGALAVQPDGKIVVAGPENAGLGASRFNPDGTPDTGFGTGGVAFARMPSAGQNDQTTATSLAVQADGKLVVAGYRRIGVAACRRFALARYDADGHLDRSFGHGGTIVEAPDGSSSAAIESMAHTSNDRILVAGTVDDRFGLARYRSNGTLDPSFGGRGVIRVSFPGAAFGYASSLAMLSDGSVLDGLGAGLYSSVRARAAALQPDGRLIVAVDQYGTLLARYEPNGRRDRSFGLDGILSVSGGVENLALSARPDGSLLASGPSGFPPAPPAGQEPGPTVMRLAVSDGALQSLVGKPAACRLDVRTKNLKQLLRRGRRARYGKLRVAFYLAAPGRAEVAAKVAARGRSASLGSHDLTFGYSGLETTDLRLSRRAHRVLRRAKKASITFSVEGAPEMTAASATETLRR